MRVRNSLFGMSRPFGSIARERRASLRRGSSQGTSYLCDAIAVIVIGTALAAMIGWMTSSRPLVQVLPDYPPLYPGSALGLAAAAAGLWGLAHRMPRWVLTGAGIAALLGGLAVI